MAFRVMRREHVAIAAGVVRAVYRGPCSWINQPVADVRCLGVEFADPTHGYAICLNTQRQSQVVVFK